MMQYLLANDFSRRQFEFILFIYRAWFNDFSRFMAWVRIAHRFKLAADGGWRRTDIIETNKVWTSVDFQSFRKLEHLERTVLMEYAAAGKQPQRGYNMGVRSTAEAPSGESASH